MITKTMRKERCENRKPMKIVMQATVPAEMTGQRLSGIAIAALANNPAKSSKLQNVSSMTASTEHLDS
jgi:hypothetical protein